MATYQHPASCGPGYGVLLMGIMRSCHNGTVSFGGDVQLQQ
jgi:hypothetical protein